MTTLDIGLPLVEAARRSGVMVNTEKLPQEGHVEANGLRLHYFDWNANGTHTKPPIIAFHGIAQNGHMWDFFCLAYAHERRIIALDQRGHGDSDWAKDKDYSGDAVQADIAALLPKLSLNIRPIFLGMSLGGRHAFTFTGLNPDKVRALITVDMGPEVTLRPGPAAGFGRIRDFMQQDDILDSFDAFVQRTMKYQAARPEWSIRGSLYQQLKQLPGGRWTWKYDPVLRDPNRRPAQPNPDTVPQAWQTWNRILCPTLIVRGANSDVFSREIAEHMKQELTKRNVRAEFLEVSKAGHLVVGENPVDFQNMIKPFLDSIH